MDIGRMSMTMSAGNLKSDVNILLAKKMMASEEQVAEAIEKMIPEAGKGANLDIRA